MGQGIILTVIRIKEETVMKKASRVIVLLILAALIISIQAGCTKQAKVLVYDDSYSWMGYVQDALDYLSLSYTLAPSLNEFQSALSSSAWDLVVFNNPYWGQSAELLDTLEDYAAKGGRLLISSWAPYFHSGHSIWVELGYSHYTTYDSPHDVKRLFADEWILSNPLYVPDLKYSTCPDDSYGVNAFPGSPVGGGRVIASFDGSTDYNQGAIFWANDGRTILNAFLVDDGYLDTTGTYINTNGNKIADSTELWIDEISYVIGRPGKAVKASLTAALSLSADELVSNAK